MADALRLYPLTTPEGVPIPLDVVRVHSLGRINFTVADQEIALASAIELLALYATEDCIISLGTAVVSVPASLAFLSDALFVPADQLIIIDKNEATELHAIRFSIDGTLWINAFRAWQDTKKISQFSRM